MRSFFTAETVIHNNIVHLIHSHMLLIHNTMLLIHNTILLIHNTMTLFKIHLTMSLNTFQLSKSDGSNVSSLETSARQWRSFARSNTAVECRSRWSNVIRLVTVERGKSRDTISFVTLILPQLSNTSYHESNTFWRYSNSFLLLWLYEGSGKVKGILKLILFEFLEDLIKI